MIHFMENKWHDNFSCIETAIFLFLLSIAKLAPGLVQVGQGDHLRVLPLAAPVRHQVSIRCQSANPTTLEFTTICNSSIMKAFQ
jgi:hypothetical protein